MKLQVLFDSEQKRIVCAEAETDFVDGLFKLLLAHQYQLVRFAGPELGAGYPDDADPANRASRMPLSKLQQSLAALDNNFFSSGGDIIKAKLTQSSDFPYAVVLSFCDGQFSNPCTILTKPSRVTKDHKCGHGQIASVCRNIYCLQANFNLILTDALSRSVTSISRQNKCAHGRCMPECDIGACLRGNIRSLLDEIDKKCTGTTFLVVDGVLNPGIRLTVANDLEVSRCSYMSTVELLRRHQPDGTLWTKIIGVEIEVDEDDFRAIARSALHGRASVLNDALGAKAAEKFAATQEDVHGADATPTFGAQTAPDAPHGDSEKSFDMLE